MITITQLVYIKPGQEETFDQFESVAIPIISKYNGRLLLRLRPSDDAVLEAGIEKPYEIHITEFESDADFQSFMKDEERKQFLHLKEMSVESSALFVGTKI